MPELPDLQAFSQNLSKRLAGKTLEKIHAINPKKLKIPERNLQRALHGATLTSVYRDGKELHFIFDNGNVLGLHLMLKGQLHFFKGKNTEKFTIVELMFTDSTGLVMTDYQGQATPTLNPDMARAPDALSKEVGYKFLKEKLNKSRVPVKKLLTNQKIMRGIGNAYADEILWHARISPFSVSNKTPDEAIKALAKSIRTVLTKAGKTILRSDPDIINGESRDFLAVHDPKKTHSPTGARIQTETSGSRKTYFTDEQKRYR